MAKFPGAEKALKNLGKFVGLALDQAWSFP
jgi:hypothetical protein